jgi:hypothetical protein
MAHNLVLNYGLYRKMEIYVSVTNDLFDVIYSNGCHVITAAAQSDTGGNDQIPQRRVHPLLTQHSTG